MSKISKLSEQILSTPEGRQIWHQERVIFETTELLCELIVKHDVTRSELASRLGKTKSYVTQLLDGSTNMTLRTISDVFLSLGYEFHPSVKRIVEDTDYDIELGITRQETLEDYDPLGEMGTENLYESVIDYDPQ